MPTPTDAADNVVAIPTTKTTTLIIDSVGESVANVDPFAGGATGVPRVTQQQIIPAAVKTPAITDLLQVVKASPGSLNLPDSTSAQFIFRLISNQGNQLLALPSVSFFIGGDKINGAHWPGPVYGMGVMPTSVFNDDYFSDGKDVVTQAVIRNNTGATQLVYCYCNWRLVFNSGERTPVLTVAPPLPIGGRGGL